MPATVKRREIRCSSTSRRGALRNVMRSNLFLYQQEYFVLWCLKSCFAAITYQIQRYFVFNNCKFTCSFLISVMWRGSPCRRSSDDANTDWVHWLSLRCRAKWQTVLPVIWSQRRRNVGCATATVATDANVVTMSPDVALLAGVICNHTFLFVFKYFTNDWLYLIRLLRKFQQRTNYGA